MRHNGQIARLQSHASVAVVGSGIVGLNAAAAIAADGHRVVVLEAGPSADTVSAVAGGLWSPFRAGPPHDVDRWSRIGYDSYARMSREAPGAGVRMIDVRLAVADDAIGHPWESCAPAGAGRSAGVEERPSGVGSARTMRVPCVDTAGHLAWLREGLVATGASFVEHRLERLADAFDLAPVVVACPGLAARELCGDEHLEAIRGVVVEVAFADSAQLAAVLDDRGPQPTYVLPRRDGTVLLGGRVDTGDERLTATLGEVEDIVARCCALVPELTGAAVLGCKVGLRPGRFAVRVAELPSAHGRLVVNYGHGGSGWTLAAGCAQDVAALVGLWLRVST